MTKWNIGVSPSGKAADSDSVIPRVQILPPQPNENQMQCIWFFVFQVSYWDVDSCPCEIGIWKRKSVSANGMFSGHAFWLTIRLTDWLCFIAGTGACGEVQLERVILFECSVTLLVDVQSVCHFFLVIGKSIWVLFKGTVFNETRHRNKKKAYPQIETVDTLFDF